MFFFWRIYFSQPFWVKVFDFIFCISKLKLHLKSWNWISKVEIESQKLKLNLKSWNHSNVNDPFTLRLLWLCLPRLKLLLRNSRKALLLESEVFAAGT
jgi:hypothetical protein